MMVRPRLSRKFVGLVERHAYRTGYLKSEAWQIVRLEALVREGGKCQICSEESIFNDAHHVYYPKSIYDTKENNLVILCRPCHNFLHAIFPECKTKDSGLGWKKWLQFRQTIRKWRMDKSSLFDGIPDNERQERSKYFLRIKKRVEYLFSKNKITPEKIEAIFKSLGDLIGF